MTHPLLICLANKCLLVIHDSGSPAAFNAPPAQCSLLPGTYHPVSPSQRPLPCTIFQMFISLRDSSLFPEGGGGISAKKMSDERIKWNETLGF